MIKELGSTELPENWQWCCTKEISQLINGDRGKNYPSRKYYISKGIPFLSAGNIDNGRILVNDLNYISQERYDLLNSGKLIEGDILYCLRGTLGKSAIFTGLKNGAIASSLVIIRIIHPIKKKFIHYYLDSPEGKKLIKHFDNGTAQPNLSAKSVSSYPIPLAPLPEQRAIVAKIELLFSELDNGIANLNAAKDKLEIFRQAVLQKAFQGELTKPTSIKWITLGEVCDKVEYGTSSKSKNKGQVPVLRMGNIQKGRLDWSDLKYSDDPEEIEKYSLREGDILFNRTNSAEHVGKTAIYQNERKAIFAGYLIRIHYQKDKVNGNYLTYFLNSHTAKQHGNKVKSFGVNQSNINGTKLKKYPFPKTTLEEQTQIVQEIETRLSVCDNAIANIEESLIKAEALRQSILKKAFAGKLLTNTELQACRQEPDWEPAAKLLERIKHDKKSTPRKKSTT